MINLERLKHAVAQRDAIKGHLSYHDVEELIQALEEAKEIMEQQVGVDGCIQVSMDPIRNWLAKYFQDKVEDNHEAQEKEPVF